MIVFDLRCSGGHVFEAWFASSGAFEDQRERRLVACPVCGDDDVAKAVMAPNVAVKGNRTSAASSLPEEARALLAKVAAAQASALADSRWVGRDFAKEARAMHDGDAPRASIHGQATIDEARALVDDGVAIAPLLVPVTPPDRLN
ncbi:MAG: DUF1178 family protein [Sphingomonas adhaesiva]|uniref:DUF1178 family protein n=1 Tax=Sphingomonas adhaesiva TaxID=28212 RepID=UPI002FF4506C